jgi:pimeloyl-ACP methyl ester carboxylesterase
MTSGWRDRISVLVLVAGLVHAGVACAQTTRSISIRGRDQTLHIYGSPGGIPIVLSSGDGGWFHLAPHVAEVLAAKGYYVVGFDVRSYLASFTGTATTLRASDAPADYRILAEFARTATGRRPILIGVSEGAGLSVLAATDPRTKADVAGVVALGLPDLNELGWRWRDAVIYVTHRIPREPTFSTAAIVDQVAPVPLAAIHATGDEFVPVSEVEDVLRHAREPKKLWIVTASNHRFSDNLVVFDQRLAEAIAWVSSNAVR